MSSILSELTGGFGLGLLLHMTDCYVHSHTPPAILHDPFNAGCLLATRYSSCRTQPVFNLCVAHARFIHDNTPCGRIQ